METFYQSPKSSTRIEMMMLKFHPLIFLLQASVLINVRCVTKPSRRDAPWSPTWERFTASTSSTPIDRDVPRSLCVRTVVTLLAALTNTSCMWSSAIQGAPPSADTTVGTTARRAAWHPQITNFTHSWRTHPPRTTLSTLGRIQTLYRSQLVGTLVWWHVANIWVHGFPFLRSSCCFEIQCAGMWVFWSQNKEEQRYKEERGNMPSHMTLGIMAAHLDRVSTVCLPDLFYIKIFPVKTICFEKSCHLFRFHAIPWTKSSCL